MKVLFNYQKFVLLFFLLCLTFSGWASPKNTFVYCSEGDPRFLNPQLASDGASLDVTGDIYDGLVGFEHGTSNVIPALAESWDVSRDGLKYTFNLRKGVSFHETKDFKPSREFNADDVIFSFNRVLDKEHPYHKVSGGNYLYFAYTGLDQTIKQIEKIDDYKIRFHLKNKSAVFLVNMAMPFAAVLSQEYANQALEKKTPEVVDQKPIGTGPFMMTDYRKGSLIRYKKNKKFWKKPASLDGVIFSITPEPSVRFQKLKRGECDLIPFPLPSDYKSIEEHKDLKLVKKDFFNIGYLAMNVEKPPLDKLEVRKAIRHAMNRDLYVDAIYLGNARVAKTPIPPTMWSHLSSTKDYEYSVEKAKALLKKAGYEDGFEIDLWTLPVSRPYNPNGKKMGELMKEDLEKVGIKVKLISYDWATYLKKSEKGEHQLMQIGWTSDNGDPDNFLAALLGCQSVEKGGNLARWCHSDFDKLIVEGEQTLAKGKRSRLYRRAQKIFGEETPWVPLVHAYGFRGANKRVQGYILPPFGIESFYPVSLSQ